MRLTFFSLVREEWHLMEKLIEAWNGGSAGLVDYGKFKGKIELEMAPVKSSYTETHIIDPFLQYFISLYSVCEPEFDAYRTIPG